MSWQWEEHVLDPSDVLRRGLLQLSKSDRVRDLVEKAPVSRDVVKRFVAGEATADAVRVAGELALTGRLCTIDNLGEDTLDLAQAQRTRDAYLSLLSALGEAGLDAIEHVVEQHLADAREPAIRPDIHHESLRTEGAARVSQRTRPVLVDEFQRGAAHGFAHLRISAGARLQTGPAIRVVGRATAECCGTEKRCENPSHHPVPGHHPV